MYERTILKRSDVTNLFIVLDRPPSHNYRKSDKVFNDDGYSLSLEVEPLDADNANASVARVLLEVKEAPAAAAPSSGHKASSAAAAAAAPSQDRYTPHFVGAGEAKTHLPTFRRNSRRNFLF